MGKTIEKKMQRKDMLIRYLRDNKKITTKDATKLMNISEATARRFFYELEQKGVVIRNYGGVQLLHELEPDYHFEDLSQHKPMQKKIIGKHASLLVGDDDVVFLDSGTTVQYMSMALADRLKDNEIKTLQLFTNSLVNFKILSPFCDVHLIGGLYRNNRQDFYGYISDLVLNSIVFKKSFLGADGVSLNPTEGVMASNIFTAKTNEILINRSDNIFLLVDSTKFLRRSFLKYADIESIDLYITDSELGNEAEDELEKVGAIIHKVNE